ncbi:MAG: V-type ATP synthase subunit F [Aerococcus sp.]|nr:V-type ATP synthase subunit F [Aerococcus sp.]
MKAKIGVVGEGDVVFPFKLLNFSTFSVENASDARKTIKQLADDDYGVIYLTENIAKELPDVLRFYESQTVPAIIVIPSQQGSSGFAHEHLRETVRQATGQDILD